ncbi:MAG: basal-body rod modification protein FlgD [Hyphococcus sp.]|nr:MAG: basal-body rod modification protein FlgD [Marinicaulis sp.]
MIETSAVSQSQNPLISAASSKSESAATAASDFKSFLTLLTAQLRNQDPLSPLDSTQFVEQLASFSAVEQQIETNSLLKDLASGLSGSGLESATQWIGKEVETVSGAAQFTGEPLEFKVPPTTSEGRAEVVVSDASGNVIHRQAVSASQNKFTWNGDTADGAKAPVGNYAVAINYVEGEEVLNTVAPIAVSQVREARLVDSEVKLVLSNGVQVEESDILAVRQPVEESDADSAS